MQKVLTNLITAGRGLSVPTTSECPHDSQNDKVSFLSPHHLPAFWGQKLRATTKVILRATNKFTKDDLNFKSLFNSLTNFYSLLYRVDSSEYESASYGQTLLPNEKRAFSSYQVKYKLQFRVPTRPRKPGKMRVPLENLEISWNFEKFNKYNGKMT